MLNPKHPSFVHINKLEFVTVIIQVAMMTIARFEAHSLHLVIHASFPDGVPEVPLLLISSDNTTAISWAKKISSKSTKGQTLVCIWTALLQRSNISISIVHLPGDTNNMAVLATI